MLKKTLWFVGIFIATCSSPYFFYGVNHLLGFIFPCIKPETYLNYMAIAFTGVPAVVISVYALNVARKAEEREQAKRLSEIRTSKDQLKEYISGCCHAYFDISKGYSSAISIPELLEAEKYINILLFNNVISKKEAEICEEIHKYATQRERDKDSAKDFCNKFLETGKECVFNDEIINLLGKPNAEKHGDVNA